MRPRQDVYWAARTALDEVRAEWAVAVPVNPHTVALYGHALDSHRLSSEVRRCSLV